MTRCSLLESERFGHHAWTKPKQTLDNINLNLGEFGWKPFWVAAVRDFSTTSRKRRFDPTDFTINFTLIGSLHDLHRLFKHRQLSFVAWPIIAVEDTFVSSTTTRTRNADMKEDVDPHSSRRAFHRTLRTMVGYLSAIIEQSQYAYCDEVHLLMTS